MNNIYDDLINEYSDRLGCMKYDKKHPIKRFAKKFIDKVKNIVKTTIDIVTMQY